MGAGSNAPKTEQALRASELSYRRLFEAAKDGILILDVDTGRIADVNPFLTNLLGFSRSEMIGQTVAELSPFKDLGSNKAMLEDLQRDGYVRYENLPLETRDGRHIAVEFVCNVYEAGDKNVIQCNVRDITERRRMETALMHLQSVVESSDDAILGKDLNGIITSWNHGAEKIFGYTAAEMMGTSIRQLIPDDRLEEEDRILEKIQHGESQENLETQRRTKSGKLIHVSITVSPIRDLSGNVIGASKVAHDITVRKQHEGEIERLSRLFAALSQVNQAIVSLKSSEALFAEICRVLVETGKLRMAWIGWIEATTRRVIPVAQWGDSLNYLAQATFSVNDGPDGQGPTGTAIREGRSYICNDFNHDPCTLPWRHEAEKSGFRSSACFVIRQGGVIGGAVTVYAGEANFFQDKEIALLEEAATDISFALDNYMHEAARAQTEIELRWKTAFLEAQVDSSPDGILVVDDQGKKILQNQRLNDLWKVPAEIAENQDDRKQIEFVSQRTKDPRQFADQVARLVAHPDEVSRDEVELVDGTILDRYSSPVRDRSGKHYGRIWNFRDITERKRTEAALLESKRFLSSTIDALTEHIAILDEQGIIVAVNAAWKHFAGENHFLGSECGMGANYLQVCDAAAGKCSEEARQVAAGIRDIISGQSNLFTLEYPCHSPLEKRWFTLRITRFEGDGAVRVVVAHENISERRRIELRFRRLVDSNAQGVIFWNTQGQITEANAAFLKLVGYTREEMEANPLKWTEMTPPEFANLDRHALKQIADTGICLPYEKEFIRKDGKRVPILIGAAGFEEEPGQGVCFVLDLTERKILEQQFRQSQKMEGIGRLAGGVAHDFNNILTAIIGYSNLLQPALTDRPKLQAYAGEIERAGQRAAGLTRQLLAFSRKQILQPQVLELNLVITDLQKMLLRLIGEDIEVTTVLSPGLNRIHADPGQIEQVILNLCVNARDAMPQGGKLRITTRNVVIDAGYGNSQSEAAPGDYVLLAIADTGIGMTADVKAHLFEPFYTTKEVGKGTGLGLATVFGIIKQSNGIINCYSELGHGTTFKIYLPNSTLKMDKSKAEAPVVSLPRGTETILLVEDEPTVRELGHVILGEAGYNVLIAANGMEALAVAAKHTGPSIALLLTDVVMPQMGGRDLAEQLRASHPSLRVLYCSGYTADGIAHHGILDSGIDFLQKPYTPSSICLKVREVLDASRRQGS